MTESALSYCRRRARAALPARAFARPFRRAALSALALLLFLLALAPAALAGPPSHPALPALDISGLNQACGTAVDSEGDTYVSSAGESKVKIFSPTHTELASIANANEPCGLAVDGKGALYVSEQATGNVVKYLPNAYPLSGPPSYGGPTTIDASGNAKGIAVDPVDDRLYVAEGSRIAVFQADGTTGQDEIQRIMVSARVTGGTYTLSFEAQTTAPIPYDAKPPQLQAALEALSTIGAGNVTVEEGSEGTRSFSIVFTGALSSKDVPGITADPSGLSLKAGNSFPVEVRAQTAGFEFNGHIGEGELTNATAVAAYTYGPYGRLGEDQRRYLFVADSASDEVAVLSGSGIKALEAKAAIDGKAVPDSPTCPDCSEGFGFGAAGAALAADWANGHLFVYDAEHGVVDEFEADGRYLDQIASPSFADAGPSGIAVLPQRSAMQEISTSAAGGTFKLGYEGAETSPLPRLASAAEIEAALEALPGIGAGNVSARMTEGQKTFYWIRFTGALAKRRVGRITIDGSGLTSPDDIRVTTTRLPGAGPGRVYVSAGAGAGAKLLAFAGLTPPSRAPLPQLSHKAKGGEDVAVDAEGYVYLLAASLIHVYDPAGAEVGAIEDFNHPRDVAVDSSGKVYVVDRGKASAGEAVTYYTPSSYPPSGATAYARHEPPLVTIASLGAEPENIAINPSDDHPLVFGGFGTQNIELDSAAHGSAFIREFAPGFSTLDLHAVTIDVYGATGDVYVGRAGLGGISIVNAAGTEILAHITGADSPSGPLPSPYIAVDQSNGHVIEINNQDDVAQEFDASGAFVGEFGPFSPVTVGGAHQGVAVDNSGGPNDGDLFVAYDDPAPGSFDLTAFGPLSYGEPPLAATGTASGLGSGNATLNGSVNPNSFDLSACKFEYLTDSQYLTNGETFAAAQSATCVPAIAEIGNGSDLVAVHADISGLDPEGRYRFRLVAENEFGPGEGKAALFGAPVIITKTALPILYTGVTLHGNVDPSGLQTRYHFEYGKGAGEYDQSTPTAELPPGASPTDVQADLTGLSEGTTYHFRLVAENDAASVSGPDQTLLTLQRAEPQSCPNVAYRNGLSANLPDCRAYELVTPADANGLTPYAEGSNSTGFNNWLVNPRGPLAGESIAYFTGGTLPGFEGNGRLDGYRAARAQGEGLHPAKGWTSEIFSPSFPDSAPGLLRSLIQSGVAADQLYSLWDIDPEVSEGTLPEGLYLRGPGADSACPGSRGHFEPVGCGSLGTDLNAASRYVSAGGGHVIFSSKEHLEEAAAPQGTTAIYDREAGSSSASVVSIKPDGSPFEAGESATYVASTEDGSGVLFKVAGTLYLHRAGETIAVAEAPSTFAGIAEDGSRVFYAASASGSAPASLFACDTQAGPCAGPEAHAPTQIAASAIFLNVSADGSTVFFTSTAALTGPEENDAGQVAMAGALNLYVWNRETEATRFLARLDSRDFENNSFAGNPGMTLAAWTQALLGERAKSPTRSTPGGQVLVFQSHAQLTSYDNEGLGEIYRHDPSAPAGQRLLCVSCDPSGAAPSGEALLQDLRFGSGVNPETLISNLTDDGARVFFQSADRLLPEDANNASDVYEWKVQGVGGCKRPLGCLALISSGQGETRSDLYGMSADGQDVFFRTLEKLVGADGIGSRSIYDARVEGGIPDPPAPAPCQGDSCQGNGASPPALPPTATSGGGTGNAEEAKAGCGKGRHQVKGRCVKKHHKPRHKRSQHRANHDRRASR
jgi:hypothetical protein